MDRLIKIFPTPFEVAEYLAIEIINHINRNALNKHQVTIALSGGNTPATLFSVLGSHFDSSANWTNVHFFWVDERCVPPENPESNYGMTRKALLDKIKIPSHNIHRIRGEANPSSEASRYSREISSFTGSRNGLPAFDIILLGLGEDGHVASVFPGNEKLFESENKCKVTFHPVTRQKRITLTGKVINNSGRIIFMVTGKNKAEIVSNILSPGPKNKLYPASFVKPAYGTEEWYLDRESASFFKI
ncbi:MAG: 6-phosphogluconolactonase [Bacteroidales bacterium]|nr:6-phosphogluconolactonase [Bacteroidales bacterium]